MFCLVQFAFGVSTAANVRVGNELGAGNPSGAKRAAYVSIALAGTKPTCGDLTYTACSKAKIILLYLTYWKAASFSLIAFYECRLHRANYHGSLGSWAKCHWKDIHIR